MMVNQRAAAAEGHEALRRLIEELLRRRGQGCAAERAQLLHARLAKLVHARRVEAVRARQRGRGRVREIVEADGALVVRIALFLGDGGGGGR